MVEYVPPPKDLSKLNVVQRYMQKGSLDLQDWLRLGALILAYWFLRPYLQRIFKKWSSDSQQGEEEQAAYEQRRAQAAVSQDIRSGKKAEQSMTLGQLLDEGAEGMVAGTSGAKVAPSVGPLGSEMKNRKQKKKGVSFAPEKPEIEKTLDWEDESEFDPRKGPAVIEPDKQGDIKEWMEKWTS